MEQSTTFAELAITQYDFTLTYKEFGLAGDESIAYAEIPWDSDLFSMPVYELRCPRRLTAGVSETLTAWLTSLQAQPRCLVCARIPTEAISEAALLAQHGFYPVEITMDISAPLARIKPILPIKSSSTFRLATAEDCHRLGEIAQSAFSADRFHLDPHLPSALADERYRQWIIRGAMNGDTIHVYVSKSGEIIGFYHVKEEGGKAFHMHLSAITKEQQGSGAGVLMAQDLMLAYREQGYQQVSTCISLNNVPIYNVFARFGFTLQQAVTTFHWVPDTMRRAHGYSL